MLIIVSKVLNSIIAVHDLWSWPWTHTFLFMTIDYGHELKILKKQSHESKMAVCDLWSWSWTQQLLLASFKQSHELKNGCSWPLIMVMNSSISVHDHWLWSRTQNYKVIPENFNLGNFYFDLQECIKKIGNGNWYLLEKPLELEWGDIC